MTKKELQKHSKFLRVFPAVYKKHGCAKTIKSLKKQQVKCLCEIIKNLLLGNIPITNNVLNKLKPYKAKLRSLSKKSVNLKKKQQLLKQTGNGFFLPFMASVLPLVLPYLTK